jgi:SdpC family antimicrobial peptide
MKECKLPIVRLGRLQFLALFLVASLALVAARPAISSTAAPAAPPAKKQKHDGEKIFRGLLFGEEGPISKMFPEIWQRPDVVEQMNTPAKARAWNALKEKTIARIRKKDPGFFQRFGDAMQSGDHFKIRDAFGEAGKMITDTISTNGAARLERRGEARMVNASTNSAAMQTECDGGICVTTDESTGDVYVDDDPAYYAEGGSQDATAMACSAIAVCAAAIALAVWKYVAVVDVAAVAYVAAVVVAIWKWKYKYSYSRSEIDSAQTLYQEEIINSVADNLYYEDQPVDQYYAYE